MYISLLIFRKSQYLRNVIVSDSPSILLLNPLQFRKLIIDSNEEIMMKQSKE